MKNSLFFNAKIADVEQTWPQPIDLSPYYSPHYYGNRHSFSAQYCARRRVSWINSFRKYNRGKLLDIGCGEGTFLFHAAKAQWQVAGTELNPTLVQALELDVWQSIEDAKKIAPFDCITLWHSLEHMPDPRAVLAEAHSLLASDGHLFIAVPNAQGWQARLFGAHWLHRDVPRHLHHFGAESLCKLLQNHGFKIIKSWQQELEYDLMGWAQSTLNCVFSTPDIFFKILTGQKNSEHYLSKAINLLGGAVLSTLALPLVSLSALAKAGGTLVIVARKSNM